MDIVPNLSVCEEAESPARTKKAKVNSKCPHISAYLRFLLILLIRFSYLPYYYTNQNRVYNQFPPTHHPHCPYTSPTTQIF